jgi:hypothetical protein
MISSLPTSILSRFDCPQIILSHFGGSLHGFVPYYGNYGNGWNNRYNGGALQNAAISSLDSADAGSGATSAPGQTQVQASVHVIFLLE